MADLCPKNSSTFLSKVEIQAPYLYKLLAGLPKQNFYLFRYYDFAERIEGCFEDEEGSVFTLHEFLDRLDSFHPKDSFGIFFKVTLDRIDSSEADGYEDHTSIDSEEDATTQSLNTHIEQFLNDFCEQQLRRNTPFEMNPGIIAKYGFTSEDAQQLKKLIAPHNKAAKRRIRAEYDALSRLNFIRNSE